MTKIDVITGFYGAGKTTFIKKITEEGLDKNKIAYLKCSSVVGEFDSFTMERFGIHGFEIKLTPKMDKLEEVLTSAVQNIFELYEPERIIIENAGNMGTKQILDALQSIWIPKQIEKNIVAVIVDAKMAVENVADYPHLFREHVEQAQTVVLRGRERLNDEELYACEMAVRKFNNHATVIVESWEEMGSSDFRGSVEITAQLESIVRNVTSRENMPLVYELKKSVKEKVLEEQEKLEGIMIHTDTFLKKEMLEELVKTIVERNVGILSMKANFRMEDKKTIGMRYLQGDLSIWEESHFASGNIQIIGNKLDSNSLMKVIN